VNLNGTWVLQIPVENRALYHCSSKCFQWGGLGACVGVRPSGGNVDSACCWCRHWSVCGWGGAGNRGGRCLVASYTKHQRIEQDGLQVCVCGGGGVRARERESVCVCVCVCEMDAGRTKHVNNRGGGSDAPCPSLVGAVPQTPSHTHGRRR
jgi:hypothetical protein